jgi:hypothetical protein
MSRTVRCVIGGEGDSGLVRVADQEMGVRTEVADTATHDTERRP